MHADDKKWVGEQIKSLNSPLRDHGASIKLRQETLFNYNKVWKEAFDAEPLQHRKDGKARSAANARLLKFVRTVNGGA